MDYRQRDRSVEGGYIVKIIAGLWLDIESQPDSFR